MAVSDKNGEIDFYYQKKLSSLSTIKKSQLNFSFQGKINKKKILSQTLTKALDDSIIDSVSIEDAHRYNDLSLLNKFRTKKIIIGLIKIASSVEETLEEINIRVKGLLEHIDHERLIAAPDCGLGLLPRELAMKN